MNFVIMFSREFIQQVFIRICRDSRFTLDISRVTSFGTIDDMRKIAAGTHPYLKKLT